MQANRERHCEQQRRWRAENRVRAREIGRKHRLKKKFGLSLEDYEAMGGAQRGRCSICCEPPRVGQRLAIDHDHATGARRGLLCRQCNTMLGKARDSVAVLARAMEYVLKYRTLAVAS